MSLDNVLPMSLDNSVTYVLERFRAPRESVRSGVLIDAPLALLP